MVSIAMIKHHDKRSLGRRGLISSYTSHHSPSSKEFTAGAEAEAMEEGGHRLLNMLSYTAQDHNGGPTHSGLGPHTSNY